MKSTKIVAGIAVAGGLAPAARTVGPIPGGWNGGWEPNGGFCLGPFCV